MSRPKYDPVVEGLLDKLVMLRFEREYLVRQEREALRTIAAEMAAVEQTILLFKEYTTSVEGEK